MQCPKLFTEGFFDPFHLVFFIPANLFSNADFSKFNRKSLTTLGSDLHHTDKKEKNIFLIYKEIQLGAVAKSYMRMVGFLIYVEMRKYLAIYEEAVSLI